MTDSSVSLALNLTKIIGTALSGAFGLLGLLTDFRDPSTKRITRWGKVAFWGIILSTIIALVSQVLESAKATRDARASSEATQAQLKKSDIILREVDRTLNPLVDVRISYWMRVPLDDPEMAEYKQRLEKGVEQIVANHAANRTDPRFGSPAKLRQGKVLQVYVPVTSPLFPQRAETIPYYVLAFSGLHLQFFIKPLGISAFEIADPAKFPTPDLEMQVNSFGPLESSNSYQLLYDLETHTLQISAYGLPSDSDSWHSDGKILSSVDLANVQLAAVIDNTMAPAPSVAGKPPVIDQQIAQLRADMILGSIILKIENRTFWLNMKNNSEKPSGGLMQRVERKSPPFPPSTLYVTTLPPDPQMLAIR